MIQFCFIDLKLNLLFTTSLSIFILTNILIFFAIFTLHWKCNQISLNISVLMILTDDCVLGAGKRTELYGFMSLEKCLKRNLASALDEKTSFFFNSFFFFFFFLVFCWSFFQLLSFTTNLVFPLFNFWYFILSFPMVCKKAI